MRKLNYKRYAYFRIIKNIFYFLFFSYFFLRIQLLRMIRIVRVLYFYEISYYERTRRIY